MLIPPTHLSEGYKRFRNNKASKNEALYRALVGRQSPQTMVIACADSRVDPTTIFDAAPGELFVVRNVANIVPPSTSDRPDFHGTGAALEFAIKELNISHIVVMGHQNCGGIDACLDLADKKPIGEFVGPWLGLLSEVCQTVIADLGHAGRESQRIALEQASIRYSLNNLATYKFVQRAIAADKLMIHGAWFSIGDATLHWLNRDVKRFETVY